LRWRHPAVREILDPEVVGRRQAGGIRLENREERRMKVLVTAATRYGATGEIARAIAEVLRGHGLDPTVVAPEQVDTVDGYDAVVLGSAVYAGQWLQPARELVGRCAGGLADRPVWLFSSGPVGDPPKPEEDPVDVAEILAATKARGHRVFAGKLDRSQLRFPDKAIVAALRVPEGDFRDWAEITSWAAGIARALRSGSPAQAGGDDRQG
jgi:menaquinone-dependent protoporphyrinogen oxidase